MDTKTRQIRAFHLGTRSRKSAAALWAKTPESAQHHAMFHPEQYDVYTGVLAAAPPPAISQQARQTKHIERFHNTLRQPMSRLLRASLSCSKQLAHHSGALRGFLCNDNPEKAVAFPG